MSAPRTDIHWDIAPPNAAALGESIRSMGYSPEAALADLVDNSITAGARSVDIEFYWAGHESFVRITDDGRGMNEAELVKAMTLGSTNPLDPREEGDLGRYGLGLKTASFSQARELTVMSKPKGPGGEVTRRWDLDTVSRTNEWRLMRDAPTATHGLRVDGFGTVVQWTKLDRLVGEADVADTRAQAHFLDVAKSVRSHLEATFHRFLSGPRKLQMTVNGQILKPWDPFLSSHAATQRLDPENPAYTGGSITVRPFVLPHRSKFATAAEADTAAGTKGWTQQQGFYVYRSNRLVCQGDWLGVGGAKDEHTKLARIAIDFPASQDGSWQVDVKKATVRPPAELRGQLRRIAQATKSRANEVYRFRGKALARSTSSDFVFAWKAVRDRAGVTSYRINRKHPVIDQIRRNLPSDQRKAVDRVLRLVEETIPVTLIGTALSEAIDATSVPYSNAVGEVQGMAEDMLGLLLRNGLSVDAALDRLASSEPFSQYPEVVATLKEAMP